MPVQGVALPSGELPLSLHIAGLPPAAQAEPLADMCAEGSPFPCLSASFPPDLILVAKVAGHAAGHGVIAWADRPKPFPTDKAMSYSFRPPLGLDQRRVVV